MLEGGLRALMVEEGALERWFALEMTRFHRSFVARPRPLAELIAESDPMAETKGGEAHRYDVATLRRLHDTLPPLTRRRVRLPATFFVDKELPDDAHVSDAATIDMLHALGEVPSSSGPRDGKLWVGHAKARLIAAKYPGAFQFVYF